MSAREAQGEPRDGWAELGAQLREWRHAISNRIPPWAPRALAFTLLVIGILLPFLFANNSGFMNATIIALAFAVMSLGLNVVVGFAGLLDLGYVAFYALGAYSLGWFGSDFFFKAHVHVVYGDYCVFEQGHHHRPAHAASAR
jgi:branched-chain amino acid transport system permease protein